MAALTGLMAAKTENDHFNGDPFSVFYSSPLNAFVLYYCILRRSALQMKALPLP